MSYVNGSISTSDSSSSGRLKKDVYSKKRNILKKRLSSPKQDGQGGCGKKDGKGGCKDGKGGVLESIGGLAKKVADTTSDKFSKGWSNTKDILKYYLNKPINALKYQDIIDEQNARKKIEPYIKGYKAMNSKNNQ